MKRTARSMQIPVERRMQLLQGIPGFANVPAPALSHLATQLEEEHFPLGAEIVSEGDFGDRLFVIVEGEAEVTTAGANAAVVLAVLGPGDMFGEIALLAPQRRRQATVTALTPVVAVSLKCECFDEALDACPDVRFDVASLAETLLTAKFLKQQSSWKE